jgi:hypothetical protein
MVQAMSIRIFPAMIVQGVTDINTAHATVDAAPADSAAITFVGAASTAYKPRLLCNKDALQLVTKDLIKPMSGTSERVNLTKIPASVRMWMDSTFATGEHRVRFDIALQANVADRSRIIRELTALNQMKGGSGQVLGVSLCSIGVINV